MPKVVFKFDKEKDAKNYYDCANSDPHWGNDFTKSLRPEVLKKLKGKKWTEVRKDTINMLKRGYSQDKERKEKKFKKIQKSWNKINDEYFKRLERVMKKPICCKKFIGYVTTMGRCPYNYKEPSFMISFFRPLLHVLNTTGHEIMHIQFHNTYWDYVEKQLGKEKTADLKEALTVLLNLEFGDLWFVYDIGYEPHKELRKFIEKQWKKNPDFDILLDKCIKYIKNRK